MSDTRHSLRPVRSFVRRESRMTDSQQRAFEELWPRYGMDLPGGAIDLSALFGRRMPVSLEIGFGNGEALAAMAAANSQHDHLGIEVHRPGVAQLLRGLALRDQSNVRVVCADANDVLARLPDDSLHAVYVFFPDPWPKKRHHKRRLVQPVFIDVVRRKLEIGGHFCLATDWEDYAIQMLSLLSSGSQWQNASSLGGYAERSLARPLTRFERRGQRLGHTVRDLAFRRIA
jgi:tRNA (guanine-N7-)-methyltransferase